MALNLKDALGLPLVSQSFRLRLFALGAVTLASVVAVVKMSQRTVRLLRVDVAGRCRISFRVFRRCDGVQVLRVHAGSVSTGMVDHEAVWYRPVRHPHRYAMSLPAGPAKCKHAVSVLVLVPDPQQAIARLLGLALETVEFFCGRPAIGYDGSHGY